MLRKAISLLFISLVLWGLWFLREKPVDLPTINAPAPLKVPVTEGFVPPPPPLPLVGPEIQAEALPPEEPLESESIVDRRTLSLLERILKEVLRDLRGGRYGEVGSLTYNIAFQYYQALSSYRFFLKNSPLDDKDAPIFRLDSDKSVLGRYSPRERRILLGPESTNSEGNFIAVLFHEYQHHLYHSFYGVPDRSDIVALFHNELSAYLFENLLVSYLPGSYFQKSFRGNTPQAVRAYLTSNRAREAIALVYRGMTSVRSEDRLLYGFLEPVVDGVIGEDELFDAIAEDFMPDPEKSAEIAERVR